MESLHLGTSNSNVETTAQMADQPILAAGGIVVRGNTRPTVAIVQLRKDGDWVLPKGKLNRGEDALEAAQREVREETGHAVTVKDSSARSATR
jgi:8-oxo-dGTP diphosphatase